MRNAISFGQGLLRKQFLSSAAIVLAGILVIAGVYNRSTVRYFREQTDMQARNVLRQTQAGLEAKITQFHNLIGLISLNPDLQNLLFNEYYYDVPALVASRQITTYFAPVDNQLTDLFTDVGSIAVYTTNPTLRMFPGQLEPVANVADTEWFKRMEADPVDRTVWMITENAQGETVLSAIRRLRNLRVSSFSANFLGYIKLDFAPERFFQSIVLPSERGSDWLSLIDANARVIAASRELGDGERAALLAAQGRLGDASAAGIGSVPGRVSPAGKTDTDGVAGQTAQQSLRVGGVPYAAWGVPVRGTEWTCWYAVSEQAMTNALNRVNLPVLLVLIGMTAAMMAASWVSTSRLTRRIGRLAQSMGELEEGTFTVRVKDQGKDEIGFLAEGFNNMAGRLGELVEREYLGRMKQREYDLSALQAQLHPHFLYNTLASISWLGMQGGMPEIPAITNALARFYRLSLSKGKNFIRVADEVRQVQAYLEIMAIRYKDKIHAEYLVAEETSDQWTLKLILQPFVENAILHGLSAQTSGIHITVAAEREGADLLFTVADDGVGIAEERLRQLTGRAHKGNGEMVGHESAAEGGYGVVNVDNRIRTYFGEPYGVSIASAPGEGTVVTLRLPLLDTPPSDG